MPNCSRASSHRSPASTRWRHRNRPRPRCRGFRWSTTGEFTVRLKGPTIDFKLRLGFSPFYPLPDAALKDMAAFGRHPIGNGPYRLADQPGNPAWQHNVKLDLVTNPALPRQPDAAEQRSAVRLLRQPRHRLRRPAVEQSRCAGHHSAQCADRLPPRPRRPIGDRARRGQPDLGHTPSAGALLRRRGPTAPPCPLGSGQPGPDLPQDLLRGAHTGPRIHGRLAARIRPRISTATTR